VASLISKVASDFNNRLKKEKVKNPMMSEIKEGIPWGFFDGVRQRHPSLCGIGDIIYISKKHFFKIF